jgi:hypothetical protein
VQARNNDTKWRRIDCAGFGFVYKAHPPVHIKICAVDGRKDKQGGVIIYRAYNQK